MVTEKEFELLDNYISNRLSLEDKAAFDRQLEGNTELQQEFHLQLKIAESLRYSRVAELKNLLNNVPISALKDSGATVLIKSITGLVAIGIVATGLYFYFHQPTETKIGVPDLEKIEVEPNHPIPPTEQQPQEESPLQTTPVIEKKIEKKLPIKILNDTKPKDVAVTPTLDVIEPVTESDSQATYMNTETAHTDKVSHSASIVLGIDKTNKKYTFHYQFKDGSLLLFGPFEKNLYEIMEYFSDDKRTIFLYYKDHFYFLKEESDKIKPLKAISDPTLIKRLRESRKK